MTEQPGFFDEAPDVAPQQHREPLAARMRPRSLDEIVGQKHILGQNRALRRSIENGVLTSLILWGPPGTGKTTLAGVIAHHVQATFLRLSAVTAGVADLRRAIDEARQWQVRGRRTIVFIDEIHRFNKAQQDVVLPHVERGLITLIGATTENPSFEVNAALLSRCRIFVLHALTDQDIRHIVVAAIHDDARGLGQSGVTITDDALDALIGLSNGDARAALTALDMAAATVDGDRTITRQVISDVYQQRTILYDKGGEQHYDLISALHKSLRDSDPDAGLYWLARMLEGGDDPLYIARRLVRFATEDIGLADPQALVIAMAAQQATHFLGAPEGYLALAEITVYLAMAPKSNALYVGMAEARRDVEQTRNDPVPLHLRNAPTGLMASLGYGAGYRYAHDAEHAVVAQQHLPDILAGRVYYHPTTRGFEQTISQRITQWQTLRAEMAPESGELVESPHPHQPPLGEQPAQE